MKRQASRLPIQYAEHIDRAQYRIASESWLLVSAAPGVIPTMLPPTHASTPSVDHHRARKQMTQDLA